MANYAASILAKGQAIVSNKYQAPEQRRQMPTVMELALKYQDISIPNAAELRTSPLRPVDINFRTNIAPGAATAKTAVHTGTMGDSAVINLTYVSHVETFSLARKMGANNVYKNQDLYNNLYEMAWKNLLTRHDVSALAFLAANRCQLSNAVMTPLIAAANPGNWSDANLALEIDNVNKQLLVQYAKSMMAARFYNGPYDIVADLQLTRDFEYAMNQGSGNYNNTAFQFQNESIFTTAMNISTAYVAGSAYILPQGLFAGLNWNEKLNRDGFDSGDTTTGSLGTINDPFGKGATADVSMYTTRSDTSGNTTGGSTQDIVDQVELTLTIGYATAPLSLAGDSPIHQVSLNS